MRDDLVELGVPRRGAESVGEPVGQVPEHAGRLGRHPQHPTAEPVDVRQLEVECLDVSQLLVELQQVRRGDLVRRQPRNYQGYVGRYPCDGNWVVLVTPMADHRVDRGHRNQDRALRSAAAGSWANHGLQR
jgi:hypothetical protein